MPRGARQDDWHSEAAPFWTECLCNLARRDPREVKLVISDAHEGLKAAVGKALGATWQRCRVDIMRNAAAHSGKTQRRIRSVWIAHSPRPMHREPARSGGKSPTSSASSAQTGALMDDAEADTLGYMGCPAAHRVKIHSDNPLERINGEIKHRHDRAAVKKAGRNFRRS